MHGLVIPSQSARLRIQRHDAIGKQVLPRAGSAIKIRRRAPRAEIDRTPFLIDDHPSPAIGPADLPVRIRWPGAIARIARQRYGMEYPFQPARDDIERPHMSRRRIPVLRHAAANDQRIPIDDARRRRRDHQSLNVMPQPRPQSLVQIDHPILPEALDRLARDRVYRIQHRPAAVDYPFIGTLFPIQYPPVGIEPLPDIRRTELPKQHAVIGPDGEQMQFRRRAVQDAVDDYRLTLDLVPAFFGTLIFLRIVGPGYRQPPDVVQPDLVQGRPPVSGLVPAVCGPIGADAAVITAMCT